MFQANNLDTLTQLLAGIVIAFFLVSLLVATWKFIDKFSRELRYLNSEIERTEGAERHYWICEKRRLWLSLIPFVRY